MYRSYVRYMLCHVRTLFSNLALVHMVPKWKRAILLTIWVYHVSDCEYFNRSTSAWVGQVNTIILRILLSDKFQYYRDPKMEACFSVHWQKSQTLSSYGSALRFQTSPQKKYMKLSLPTFFSLSLSAIMRLPAPLWESSCFASFERMISVIASQNISLTQWRTMVDQW